MTPKLTGALKSALVLLASAALLTWLGWGAMIGKGPVLWDFAVDMLNGNRIRDEGVLLVGHYSRYEFNHPGPFWFYYNHIFEGLLRGHGLERLQIWNAGQILLTAMLTAFTACGLSLVLLGRVFLAPALLVVLVMVGFAGSALIGLWMPYRLIAPYAAFLVSCALIAQGRLWLMVVATFLACMLIHGYATMPLFTLPFLGVATLLGYRRQRWQVRALRRLLSRLLPAALVALVFVLPIVYDALVARSSNLSKMLAAQEGFATAQHPSWSEMLNFLWELIPQPPFLWLLGAAMPLLLVRPLSRRLLQWAAWLAASLMLLVAYYRTTPAPLYPFVAQFFTIVPVLLLAALLIRLWEATAIHLGQRNWIGDAVAFCVGLGIAILLLPAQRVPTEPTAPYDEPEQFANFIAEDLPVGEVAALDYSSHDSWPFIAGLLLELDEHGIPACTTWRHMSFLYTDLEVCAVNQQPRYQIVATQDCAGRCIVNGLSHGAMRSYLQPVALGVNYALQPGALRFSGWYSAEPERRWSFGNNASITFAATGDNMPTKLLLRTESLGKQRLQLWLNERSLYQGTLSGNELVLELPLQGLSEGTNLLRFSMPDAHKPPGSDPRILAVALRDLRFE